MSIIFIGKSNPLDDMWRQMPKSALAINVNYASYIQKYIRINTKFYVRL